MANQISIQCEMLTFFGLKYKLIQINEKGPVMVINQINDTWMIAGISIGIIALAYFTGRVVTKFISVIMDRS
ncbi:MAG: hypothetical protein OEZ02_14815, partial [Anaerolineae bacterium]|nr:hypothetical protein [Anaerolineae bacterium]